MSHAPHTTSRVLIDRDNEFLPAGIERKLLRAERFYTAGDGDRTRIFLTLSDYYADEYDVNMGPNTPESRKFVTGLVERSAFCRIKPCVIQKKDGTVFRKPIVSETNDTSFFDATGAKVVEPAPNKLPRPSTTYKVLSNDHISAKV